MKKLSLIAVAALAAGAAGAAEPQFYARADYGWRLDRAQANGAYQGWESITKGSAGFGVRYGDLVVEVPTLADFNKIYLGLAIDLSDELTITPQVAYKNELVKGAAGNNVWGLKIETEYKVSPKLGLALTLGKGWNTLNNPGDEFAVEYEDPFFGPMAVVPDRVFINSYTVALGGKFYF